MKKQSRRTLERRQGLLKKGTRSASFFALIICIPVVLSMFISGGQYAAGAGAGRDEALPGWMKNYLEKGMPGWEGWKNALEPSGESSNALRLAEAGRTEYVIVIPVEATPQERKSAEELRSFLNQITGAEFEIVDDSGPARGRELSVGRTNRLEASGLDEADKDLGEGYSIAVEGERVYLLGGERSGPLYAVYALLEEDLGCRWYSPEAERVLYRPTLEVEIARRTFVPDFLVRDMYHVSGMYRSEETHWYARNRLNYYGRPQAENFPPNYRYPWMCRVHTLHFLVPPEKYFEDHPEYFPLIDGERRKPTSHSRGMRYREERAQLCLSNPGASRAAARTVIEDLKDIDLDPWQKKLPVQIGPMDYRNGECECGDCSAIAEEKGLSGLYLDFVNRVAEIIEEDLPGITVSLLLYRQTKAPPECPETRAGDNVMFRFCTDHEACFDWPYHSFYDGKYDVAREHFLRWGELSGHPMHVYTYPHNYRHNMAPEPNTLAVAENIRFFAEQNVEKVHIHLSLGGRDRWEGGWMEAWIFSKLMWDPALDPEELMLDFIWGYYGEAAPYVVKYKEFMFDHFAEYADFDRSRHWIYDIHDEEKFKYGFTDKAREILKRAETAAESAEIRRRVEMLLAGVVYVEAVQLYVQMSQGIDVRLSDYNAVLDELSGLYDRLGIEMVRFNAGRVNIVDADEFIQLLRDERERRARKNYLPRQAWGSWRFRKDPGNAGVDEGWYRPQPEEPEEWVEITVPAHLSRTDVGEYLGYGWYRTTFNLSHKESERPLEIHFSGVDEQAWVYVNGEYVGEHTVESEALGVGELWNRPFSIPVGSELLESGENLLAVRFHASMRQAGIHQAVEISLLENEPKFSSDGSIVHEDFSGVDEGGIPGIWDLHMQVDDDGEPYGRAGVLPFYGNNKVFRLRDTHSYTTVWSVSDEVLPEDNRWAVEFDFFLDGRLIFGHVRGHTASGALFGLKRGRRRGEFLPLVSFDNNIEDGEPVRLLGLGKEIESDIRPAYWHRLIIRREGTTWYFYLNDELRKKVEDIDTGKRGYALGSFYRWHHVAGDVYLDNFRIGRFSGPDGR